MADILGWFEQAVLVAVLRLREDAYGRAIFKEVERAWRAASRPAPSTPRSIVSSEKACWLRSWDRERRSAPDARVDTIGCCLPACAR